MPQEIRYKLTLRQQIPYAAVIPVAAAERWLLDDTDFQILKAAAIALVLFLVVRLRMGCSLTPEGIVLRAIRTKLIPWKSIARIESRTALGGTAVRLYLTDGKWLQPRAPLTGSLQRDPQFETKLATIRQWWTFYAGQVAQPESEAAA